MSSMTGAMRRLIGAHHYSLQVQTMHVTRDAGPAAGGRLRDENPASHGRIGPDNSSIRGQIEYSACDMPPGGGGEVRRLFLRCAVSARTRLVCAVCGVLHSLDPRQDLDFGRASLLKR